MSGIPDFALETTYDHKFTTRRFSTGAPFAFDSGVVEIYEDNSTTQITGAETLTLEFDGVAGLHNLRIAMTSANGFATDSSYSAVVSAGTVDSVSVVGETIFNFTIEKQSALRPTVDGRTLDVEAGGTAGIDWGNVANPTTVLDLSATDIQLCDTATTVTNQLSAAAINAEVDTALNTAIPGGPTADSINQRIVAIDALTEAAGSGDLAAILIDTADMQPRVVAIEIDTNELQADWKNTGRLDVILDARMAEASISTTGGAVDTVTAVTNDVGITATAVNLIFNEAMVETSGAPAITGTFRAGFEFIFALSRNKILQTATLGTLRNDADDADLATVVLADNGTTYTRAEWST